jgi:hypothetical protein
MASRTESQRNFYKRNRKRLLQWQHDWYMANRERILAQRKAEYRAKKRLRKLEEA